MSMDLDPVPGLPLLTTLFCNTSTVKKKTTVNCQFPDQLYAKKALYGGPIGVGVGLSELLLLFVFFLLSFKMKHDVTKAFLTMVYIPLGFSSVFKVALGLYGILEGAYGWFYMVALMFYNWLYTTAVLNCGIGSIIYLAALIVIARKRQNFNPCESWISYYSLLFFSALLSGSYHFVSYQWNQLPAASLFFTYVLATIAIFAELLVCVCVGFLCTGKKMTPDLNYQTGDPVVDDARHRLGFGVLAILIMNLCMWYETYVKVTELFTPFLWDSDEQKKVFYTSQSVQLLTLDTIRLFLSYVLIVPLFVTSAGRYAVHLYIEKRSHPNSRKKAQSKVFVATQIQPLLMDTGEKKKEHHHEEKRPIPPTPPVSHPAPVPAPIHAPVHAPPPITTQPVALPNQVPMAHPPQYPAIGFAPGMLQLPQNMQTTIVYTPAMAMQSEQLK